MVISLSAGQFEMSNAHSKPLSETGEQIQGVETMKMAKKMLVLAIVATGTLMASTGTSSALADVGGHLLVQNTKTVTPKGKKGTRKASASRKRRGPSARAKNAERRRQRQLKRQRERLMTEFTVVCAVLAEQSDVFQVELLEMLVVAVEEGDAEVALKILDELENDDEDCPLLFILLLFLLMLCGC
ncbi:MAG TPA: hypothetical protein DCE47_17265 [Planctomycetaceae bacterium]|nr:hypothetical protein [Planctomycetaceae bacterium]